MYQVPVLVVIICALKYRMLINLTMTTADHHHQSWFYSFLVLSAIFICISDSFPILSTVAKRFSSSSRLCYTTASAARAMAKQAYTDSQLKDALDSLLQGSSDPTDDGRHIYGYGNQSHTLSMLQTITATRILDYATYMVSEGESYWSSPQNR